MVIGLTGGIASGKSTVSRMLVDLGATLIDADQIAREVVKPGEPTLQQIINVFGEEILLENRHLNREKLGQIIFQNEDRRKELNAIIHPAIRQRMSKRRDEAVARGEQLIVLDIPLLFESELEFLVEKILVVYVPEKIQKERLIQRDQIDERVAQMKMQSQIPIEQKKHKGHAYINNSGTLEETKRQLIKILHTWGSIQHETNS